MLLKRHYRTNEEGAVALDYTELKHTGTTPGQNFSTSLIGQGQMDGWIELSDTTIKLKVKPEMLVYKILRKPGYYCCHNGARIELSPEAYGDPALAAIEARAFLKANGFEGKVSPDPNNPAGYMRLHAYECLLDAKQHDKFKAKPGALASSMKQIKGA